MPRMACSARKPTRQAARSRWPWPISIALVGVVLWATGVDYDTYLRGGSLIAKILKPAAVNDSDIALSDRYQIVSVA